MVKRGLAFGGILAILSGVGIYNNIYATETGTTKFSVDVNNAVLELTVPSNPAVIDLNPTMTNASFGSTSINIHVATNNITGYTLTMTPTNDTYDTPLIRTELIGDEQNYREIETLEQTDPISTGYTEETFTANKWGYKITGDNYYGIDPENTTVSHPAWATSAPTNGTNHNLTLAAKVDTDTVSGAYETTLNFRAVTNAVLLVTLEMSYGFHGKQKVTVGNEEYYKMQDMTSSICNATTEIPSELEVVDVRDNAIYHIGKLLDGRCWLLDNLALDPVDPNVKAILSPENTNASQAAIDNYIASSGAAPQPGWSTTAVSYETSTSATDAPRINIVSKDLTRSDFTNPDDTLTEANNWKFGVYYNYCAASIGTYCYSNNDGIDTDSTSSIDVKNDICPTGWRIPTGGTGTPTGIVDGNGEYKDIYNYYKGSSGTGEGSWYRNFRLAMRLPLSGRNSNGLFEQGIVGRFWSSTYGNTWGMRELTVNSHGGVTPHDGISRSNGLSMRCIAK